MYTCVHNSVHACTHLCTHVYTTTPHTSATKGESVEPSRGSVRSWKARRESRGVEYHRVRSYNLWYILDDTADGVLSELASCKMVIHPFISEQKDFGYSDVTQSNQEHAGRIREHFAWANRKFDTLRATLEIK